MFGEIRQPKTDYLAVPEVSSERRKYVPIAYLPANIIASNRLYTIENVSGFHFGVICSSMHMAWMRSLCGRLESRYTYSASLVYNNFPWPDGRSGASPRTSDGENGTDAFAVTDRAYKNIESAAKAVLAARAAHPNASLADLYDPLTMPAILLKAHQVLDKAVDAAYGYKGAQTDAARVAFLFARYQQITSLLPVEKAKKSRKKTA